MQPTKRIEDGKARRWNKLKRIASIKWNMFFTIHFKLKKIAVYWMSCAHCIQFTRICLFCLCRAQPQAIPSNLIFLFCFTRLSAAYGSSGSESISCWTWIHGCADSQCNGWKYTSHGCCQKWCIGHSAQARGQCQYHARDICRAGECWFDDLHEMRTITNDFRNGRPFSRPAVSSVQSLLPSPWAKRLCQHRYHFHCPELAWAFRIQLKNQQ